MARTTPWEDEYTLLCERCGYVIEGLPTDGDCPECGKPISESLPERRIGTPWQADERFSIRLLTATWWQTVRHPQQTLESLRVEHHRSHLLLQFTLIGACVLASGAYATWARLTGDSLPWLASVATGSILCMLALFPLLWLLSKTEQAGIWFIARRRGWRLDSILAGMIVAHGSVGWLVGSAAASGFASLAMIADSERWHSVIFGAWFNWPVIFAVLAIASAIGGLLIFEGFAYLGMRRCRFANRARPIAHAQGSIDNTTIHTGEPGA